MTCTRKYEIWIRDNYTLETVGMVRQYKQAEFVRRKNRTGSFSLTFDITCNSFPLQFANERYGIVVYREGSRIFTGPITHFRRTLNRNEREFVIVGTDDKGWLERRLTLPAPYYMTTQFTAAYHQISASAEKAMKEYVDKNLGPSAPSSRRLPNLIIEPNGANGVGLGTGVNYKARFQKLSKVVQDLSLYISTHDFDLVQEKQQDGSEKYVFKLVPWYDRYQEKYEFSTRRGNLISYDLSYEIPDYNMVLVGGGRDTGQGNDPLYRQFAYGGNDYSRSRWGDIEYFVDKRGTTNQAELKQAVWDALRIPNGIPNPEQNMFGKINVEVTVTDIPGMELYKQWKEGDMIHCVLDYDDETGDPITEIIHFIKEVRITLDPKQGETIEAVIGSNDYRESRRLVPFISDAIYRLEERLLQLEGDY